MQALRCSLDSVMNSSVESNQAALTLATDSNLHLRPVESVYDQQHRAESLEELHLLE